MEFPKLTDKLYGELSWDDYDEDDTFWFTNYRGSDGEFFEVTIKATSSADFMAVSLTHATFRRLRERFDSIKREMIEAILDEDENLSKNNRRRTTLVEKLMKNLQLQAVNIATDLSAELQFGERDEEELDEDEYYYAIVDREGELEDAGLDHY